MTVRAPAATTIRAASHAQATTSSFPSFRRLPWGLPPEYVVPKARTGFRVPDQLSLRMAFLLRHVDGCSTLSEIARYASLDIDEVQSAFAELAILGAVDIHTPDERASLPPPASGIRAH